MEHERTDHLFKKFISTFFIFGTITCKVSSRMRGGIGEAEVRQMQEKAANQWMREERRGDRRGGAEGERLISQCQFLCLRC